MHKTKWMVKILATGTKLYFSDKEDAIAYCVEFGGTALYPPLYY